jgi:hypothetical protein
MVVKFERASRAAGRGLINLLLLDVLGTEIYLGGA